MDKDMWRATYSRDTLLHRVVEAKRKTNITGGYTRATVIILR